MSRVPRSNSRVRSAQSPGDSGPETKMAGTTRAKVPLMSARGERQSQVTLQMRESLHRELSRRAFESGMTLRGYILNALRKSGLKVTDADMVDRRRRE